MAWDLLLKNTVDVNAVASWWNSDRKPPLALRLRPAVDEPQEPHLKTEPLPTWSEQQTITRAFGTAWRSNGS